MAKHYLITCFILSFFAYASPVHAQDIALKGTEPRIEKLAIYPNPVNSNRQFIYIDSKLKMNKKIEFFNAIGKNIYSTYLTGNELNISKLSTGIYYLKITENNISETRKLVIN